MAVSEGFADMLISMLIGDIGERKYTVAIPTSRDFRDAARHVLWVLEGPVPNAQEPGTFTTELIRTMCHADMDNLSMMARIYPALASHVHLYKKNPEGEKAIHSIAALELT